MVSISASANHLILLKHGNFAPVVTTVQLFMRRHQPHSLIKADGIFGNNTKGAVKAFQKKQLIGDDGSVGNETWKRFEKVSATKLIDVVDGTEPGDAAREGGDIRGAGGDPIMMFGMSNGIEVLMNEIAGRAGSPGSIALLRIHGHGGPGTQGMTAGELDGIPHLADLSVDNFSKLTGKLLIIKKFFLPFGSVQLHGCNVGQGNRGKELLQKLAKLWEVPVSAGVNTQFSGGAKTFKFEGATVTKYPGGGNLKAWSKIMETTHGNVSMPT